MLHTHYFSFCQHLPHLPDVIIFKTVGEMVNQCIMVIRGIVDVTLLMFTMYILHVIK